MAKACAFAIWEVPPKKSHRHKISFNPQAGCELPNQQGLLPRLFEIPRGEILRTAACLAKKCAAVPS